MGRFEEGGRAKLITPGAPLAGLPAREINAGVIARREQLRLAKQRFRRRGAGGGGSSTTVNLGRVESCTAATIDDDGNGTTLGTISLWQLKPASVLASYDEGTSYSADDMINLTAVAFSTTEDYVEDDRVLESGNVYSCKAAGVTNGSAFDAGDWDLMDTEGVKRATSSTTGTYTPGDWADVDGDLFIERNGATVDLDWPSTIVAAEGSLAKWIGDEVVYGECEAPAGWM